MLDEERHRLARRAKIRLGIQAAAFAISVGLLVAAWWFAKAADQALDAGTSAGPICALAIVAASLWSLVRRFDEMVACV